MPWPVRRSRTIAAGLSVGALVGLVAGMAATDRSPVPPVGADTPAVSAPDPSATGVPATPPSMPAGRNAQTITSAS